MKACFENLWYLLMERSFLQGKYPSMTRWQAKREHDKRLRYAAEIVSGERMIW